MPSLTRTVRSVSPVFMLPSKPSRPTAPPYQARGDRSWSSMNCIAHVLGAPVTVTAHAWARNASSASKPSRSRPSTWSTVWMSREYISICRRPITRTLPGRQIRDLSLRSTSVHIVSSDSSFSELSSRWICAASPSGSSPRAIVAEIGQVSTRSPSTLTYISGEAPTTYSSAPRLKRKPYGAGLRSRSRRNSSDGGIAHGSKKGCPGTTSTRSPRRNAPLLLGEALGRRRELAGQPGLGALRPRDGREGRERGGDGRQQRPPALVQRVDADRGAARCQLERRIDEPHVPARVAARVLVAR